MLLGAQCLSVVGFNCEEKFSIPTNWQERKTWLIGNIMPQKTERQSLMKRVTRNPRPASSQLSQTVSCSHHQPSNAGAASAVWEAGMPGWYQYYPRMCHDMARPPSVPSCTLAHPRQHQPQILISWPQDNMTPGALYPPPSQCNLRPPQTFVTFIQIKLQSSGDSSPCFLHYGLKLNPDPWLLLTNIN